MLEQKVAYDVDTIRKEFPILQREMNGHPLVFLDSAASSQKPTAVIKAIENYYNKFHANVHRGVYQLSQEATDHYESARKRIASYINAASDKEVIFTSGTTDSINTVAHSLCATLSANDEILITAMEHHSNIVPWQMMAERYNLKLKVAPVDDRGVLDLDAFNALLTERTKLIAVVHISNTLGTINPVREITAAAHSKGALVLVDGAQAMPHTVVDVQALDVDFYAFSGHKMYGPTGIGILYGKKDILGDLPPFKGGGEMIEEVTFEKTTYNTLPHRFEAGTPNMAGAIGLAAAIDFMEDIGVDAIQRHESHLLKYATRRLEVLGNIKFIGTADEKAGVISFLLQGAHPYDVGAILDKLGIAVRTGHHCTQPLMQQYGIPGTVRASFGLYNTEADVDALIKGIERASKMLLG